MSNRVILGIAVGLALIFGSGLSLDRAIQSRQHTPPSKTTVRVRSRVRSAPPHRSPPPKPLPTPIDPSAKHPLTILSVGDSLGEDLGYGLQDVIGNDPYVHVVADAVGSTGLVNVAYYNWPLKLAEELRAVHPQLVVVLLGGNDALSFDQAGRYVAFGSDLWRKDYGARVAKMMSEATKAGAKVVWVGLPIMAKDSVLANSSMRALNSVYYQQAHAHPGVTFLSIWKLYQDPAGQFTEYLKDPAGMTTIVRDSDGVHIAPPAGQELVASATVADIYRVDRIRVCLQSTDYWTEFNPPGCPR